MSRRTAEKRFWRETQQKIPGGICLSEFTLLECAPLVGRTPRQE